MRLPIVSLFYDFTRQVRYDHQILRQFSYFLHHILTNGMLKFASPINYVTLSTCVAYFRILSTYLEYVLCCDGCDRVSVFFDIEIEILENSLLGISDKTVHLWFSIESGKFWLKHPVYFVLFHSFLEIAMDCAVSKINKYKTFECISI